MTRQTLILSGVLSCGALLCTGCGWVGEAPAVGQVTDARQPAEKAQGKTAPQAKTQIIRTLLKAVEEAKGEKQAVKDELRKALLEADAELAKAIGEGVKRPILPRGQEPGPPTAGDQAPAKASKAPGSKRQQKAPRPGEPKTPIVKALLQVLDEVEVDEQLEGDGKHAKADDGIKDRLGRTLREADVELRKFLGGNSKRRILQANRKARAPVIGPGEIRRAKPKKEPAPEKPAEKPAEEPAEKP
jgi:hypothetical protein